MIKPGAPSSSQQTLSVHRCRFIDYTPSAIGALAFPPLPLPKFNDGKRASRSPRRRKFGTLAVGRANGNIEICEWSGAEDESQSPQAWTVTKILYGPNPSKVDSLVFTLRYPDEHSYNEVPSLSDLRLFSAGGGSELLEWDLSRGTVLRTINSQGGAIWSMAANPASTLLALGCEDGSIRLLSLEHDTLAHHRRFDRVKCKILSLAWGPPVPPQTKEKESKRSNEEDSDSDDDEDEDWSDSWLVSGCSDSSIRKWDVNSGRVLDRMTTDKARGERTLVWAVGVLGDGTIISGDSLGVVKFWDSRTCTQLSSFQSHGADVLCLAIGPDGESIFTSGVDQKVCLFTHVKVTNSDKNASALQRNTSRWVLSISKRMHSHDVRSLAIWPPYLALPPSSHRTFPSSFSTPSPFSNISPILASGGLDASVVLAPCASASSTARKIVNPLVTSVTSNFEDAYHRRMAYPTGLTPSLRLARRSRYVTCANESSVAVWRVLGRAKAGDDELANEPSHQDEEGQGYERLLDMELNMTTNISASAISDDGRWLSVADVYETKLFELNEENGQLRPRRVKQLMSVLQSHLPKISSSDDEGEGASALGFTPDSTRLVIATSLSASVFIVDLTSQPLPRVLRRFDHHRKRAALFAGRVIRRLPRKEERAEATKEGGDEDEDVEMDDADDNTNAPDSKADGGSESDSSLSSSSSSAPNALITRLAISPDGQWLATTDTLNRTHVFSLDAVVHHAALPIAHTSVAALSFAPSPAPPGTLLLALADHSLSVFDAETKRTPAWAEKLADRSRLPKRFTGLHDVVLGIAFDAFAAPDSSSIAGSEKSPGVYALLWGSTWLCRLELGADADLTGGPWGGFSKKRPRDKKNKKGPNAAIVAEAADSGATLAKTGDEAEEEETNFKLVTKYRPLLLVDFMGPNELLVVERPLIDVLAKLPPAFFKPKYGS